MNWTPLFESSPAIILHTLVAFAAIALGGLQFLLPKGTGLHRAFGYIWATMMMVIALSSFAIHEIRLVGIWSPIHLLSILILFTVPYAVIQARRGNIKKHRSEMIQIYVLALIITGTFTLWPTRTMHDVLFGG